MFLIIFAFMLINNCTYNTFKEYSYVANGNDGTVIFKSIFIDSSKKAIVIHRNGKIIDSTLLFYPSGTIHSKYIYSNDSLNRLKFNYFKNERVAKKSNYLNGNKDVEQLTYYKNGSLKSKDFFSNGSLVYDKKAYFDSLGKKLYKWVNIDSSGAKKFIKFYSNGKKDYELSIQNNKLNGESKYWDMNEFLYERTYYIDGKIDSSNTNNFRKKSVGRRSASSILKVVRKKMPAIRNIYNYYLQIKRFEGKLHIKFWIKPDGRVSYVIPVYETMNHSKFICSILNKVSKWKFSRIEGKEDDIVTIPFNFSQ